MIKKLLPALLSVLFIFPFSASALTQQERTTLIFQLVAKVLELQKQIVALGGTPIAIPPGLAALAQQGQNPTTPSTTPNPLAISFTAPATSTVSGTVTLTAVASSTNAILGVQFKLDGANLNAEDTTSPYSISWNTASTTNGAHTLAAVARDAAGNRATSTRAVTISNAAVDMIPPAVPSSLSATVISQTQINLSWSSSADTGGSGLAGYKVYRNTVQIGTTTNTSFQNTDLTASTTYTYAVAAYDNAGNISAKSAGVSKTTLSVATSLTSAQQLAAKLHQDTLPVFKADHTLPPLTRWGWQLNYDLQKELAEEWGYALDFGMATTSSINALQSPASLQSRLVALTKSDPKRYPMSALVWRGYPALDPAIGYIHDSAGNLIKEPIKGANIFSPLAPDSYFKQAGQMRANSLKGLVAKVPVSIVLNGGEDSPSLANPGLYNAQYEQDPAVVAARAIAPWTYRDYGPVPWAYYISERKAHQENIISDSIRAAVPNRILYVYYPTGGPLYSLWNADRASQELVDSYWGYPWMRAVSDMPSNQYYTAIFNKGYTVDPNDLLSQMLKSKGLEFAYGDYLSYNWVANYGFDSAVLPNDRYIGFLKMAYGAGMMGGIAGYFSYPADAFGTKWQGGAYPDWLVQMMALSQVHAAFSWLEPLVHVSDLLPGPAIQPTTFAFPAYEFPTGDAGARVVARRHRGANIWLVVAWAQSGDARTVSIAIPDLGTVSVVARPAGSIYLAKPGSGSTAITLLDSDAMHPSIGMQTAITNAGGLGSSISNSPIGSDTKPPSVRITSPKPASWPCWRGSENAIVAAADDNVGVTSVQFQLDGANYGSPIAKAPYLMSLNTTLLQDAPGPDGKGVKYAITAIARDAAGNTSTSAPITHCVYNYPIMSILTPAASSTVSGIVTLTASSTGITPPAVRAQYYIDGSTSLGTATSSALSYKLKWDTTTTTNGLHVVKVVGSDWRGYIGTSPTITVMVKN
ncbi:fibronectin type III domain-containing protein [Candidatus Kaiserbacteria bacterium]|nr:fibronectin type III domain-containing protein [Candidatus Kaiserbacteria bacterium]